METQADEGYVMELMLSIIVPVYNVKPYLAKCIGSLLRQDLRPGEYEIILVDDGSTDGGGESCDRFRSESANIRVIHQSNQGLSAARNAGLQVAKGRYVLFVDSDDWIKADVLRGLVDRMERDRLDVLRFGYRRVNESGAVLGWNTSTGEPGAERVQSGKEFLLNHLWFSCYAWQFMLRREWLVQGGLFFKPGIIFEDTEWTPRVLNAAERVCSTGTLVYYYLDRQGSITRGKAEKIVEGQLLLIDEMKSQMRQVKDKRWYEGMIAHLAVSIVSTLATDLYAVRHTYLSELAAKDVFPLRMFQAKKKARRKMFLINLSPKFACWLIHCLNR